MAEWSPAGGAYRISERASASARLERSYRRLVACYPPSFRSENTEEIIAVLLATARDGQRRPSLAEAADLLRGAVRMRLGLSRCPRTVLYAVRLMYLGAIAQIAVLVTLLMSAGAIHAALIARALRLLGPDHSHAVTQQVVARASGTISTAITADVVITLFAIACWPLLAWANGKGISWGRPAAVLLCLFYTAIMVVDLFQGDMRYAPALTITALVVAAIGIAATVPLVLRQSWPYYNQQAVTQ